MIAAEFEGYVRRHEADANAHAAERRAQESEWHAKLLELQVAVNAALTWQNQHNVLHAGQQGELRGIKWMLGLLGLLITAFGGTTLYIVRYH